MPSDHSPETLEEWRDAYFILLGQNQFMRKVFEKLAVPESIPATEEAALVQIEVAQIARETLESVNEYGRA